MEWTSPARKELERYLDSVRVQMESQEESCADPNEVLGDIRAHITEELRERGAGIVTLEALESVLSSLGKSEALAHEEERLTPEPETRTSVVAGLPRWIGFLLTGSIALSYLTLFIESITHPCAGVLFDPIPTFWHWLLVFLVPTSQVVVSFSSGLESGSRRRWLGALSGLGIGVAFYYTLLFLPVLPFALILVLAGMGLLALSPLIAFICSIYLHLRMKRTTRDGTVVKLPTVWVGIAAGLLILPLANSPGHITNYGMRLAASDQADESLRGIRFLRSFGSEEQMLENCYAISHRRDLISNILNVVEPVYPEQARTIYYRVTGRPFNSVAPPSEWKGNWLMDPDLAWREQLSSGGKDVAERSTGLSLEGSRLDSMVLAEEAMTYTEWTMTFRNTTNIQCEARAQILLPPGGAVSRLTLWIDGEEKEAAFGGRSQTRDAYQSVVQRRRDPVLVTTSGPDRVFMQCFPVLPRGGKMKVRLGITAPLLLESLDQAVLRLPAFTERNFGIQSDSRHLVWVESTGELSCELEAMEAENPASDSFTLRGELFDRDLANPESSVHVSRPNELNVASCKQSFEGFDSVVIQEIVRKPMTPPERIMIVVDGSAGMQEAVEGLVAGLNSLPSEIEVGLIVAGDEVLELVQPVSDAGQKIARALEMYDFEGGVDPVPALAAAWDACANRPNSLVLFVHAAQPGGVSSPDALMQRMERRSDGPRVLTVRAVSGPNSLLRDLGGKSALSRWSRTGSLSLDLQRLFDRWTGGVELTLDRRATTEAELLQLGETVSGSRHVARLWALGTARDLSSMDSELSTELALHYKLVTPQTGAVVLETDEQYEQAGLEPGDKSRVPSVPEPEMWLLLLVTIFMFGIGWSRRAELA